MLNIVDFSDLTVASSLQEAESWIDERETENARLLLARATGQPEPVLYDDEVEEREEEEDYEALLNDVIDIQERMAKGMEMRKECWQVLNNARNVKRIPYEDYIAWVERDKKLKAHWWYLKDCCETQIGEERGVWKKFFILAEEIIDRIGYSENSTSGEEIDIMKAMLRDSIDDYLE